MRTRRYLRRRAWRYFRRLGFQRPQDYPVAIARALRGYRDEDLAQGEDLLESWGLVQACFRHHDALQFTERRIRLREGRRLSALTPAPRFFPLWRTPAAFPVLLALAAEASARLVRCWAMR